MGWWRQDQLDLATEAIRAAGSGVPTALSVEGDPGQGKTSMLREVELRADGFHVLRAEGIEALADVPYAVVGQWLPEAAALAGTTPFQVAQQLRTIVDRLANTGPVLLSIDDLHWADPESVETVAWVLRRAAGDRLLVAGGTRPLRPPAQPVWRRLVQQQGTVRILLDGLRLPEASELCRTTHPELDDALAARLWEHTGGNPLYLLALADEFTPQELAGAEQLPAPGDLTDGTARRMASLTDDAARMVAAAAVLGTAWSPLTLVASLAEVPDPIPAARAAVDSGLLREDNGSRSLQVVHTLIRAAVEAGLAQQRRRELHLRAAMLVSDPTLALRHRYAAAAGFDDTLADDLAEHARVLHRRGEFRMAGSFLTRSGDLTTDPRGRESRVLDGLFERLLARDEETLALAADRVRSVADEMRGALVSAGTAILARCWLDGRRILEAVPEAAVSGTDDLTRYRFLVLRGWTRVMTGGQGAEALADLTRAQEAEDPDPALFSYLSFAVGQAQMATGREGRGWGRAALLPAAAASSATDTAAVAWRGGVYALGGRFDDGIPLLEEVTRRARDGLTSFGEGVFHAYLGYAEWMRGRWPAAQRHLELATAARHGALHPMVAACAPLLALARGDWSGASAASTAGREVLLTAPWPPAVHVAGTAQVLLVRLTGTEAQRRGVMTDLTESFGPVVTTRSDLVSPTWLLHRAFATLWAGDIAGAEQLGGHLERASTQLPWLGPAARWVAGLVAESRGDVAAAGHHLTLASTDPDWVLPLHHALILDDLARVQARSGSSVAARLARTEADRELASFGLGGSADHAPHAERSVLAGLSDRERDVVGLLVEGLSYVQIARELFVTRSTVAFHLSNVYAKTNTATRHELVDLVRRSH